MAEEKIYEEFYPDDEDEETKGVIPNKYIINHLAENEFVKSISESKKTITYSKSAYVMMYKYMTVNGLTPLQAYEMLGFDVSVLGKDRAYAVARRAKELAKDPNFGLVPDSYDGSIPRELMGDLGPLEENAYMKARIMYLEFVQECKKKLVLELVQKK